MGVGTRGFRPQARGAAEHDPAQLRMPWEAAAGTLDASSSSSSSGAGQGRSDMDRGKVLRTYKWSQFYGKEEITEFDEAHFATEGKFQAASSQGHKEYQDRIRAIHLRKEGMQKAEIAKALGRSEQFVQKWWQKENKEIPRPWGVHAYLTKDMGKKSTGVGATNGATETDDAALDLATWWRDVEVRRKYADSASIYEDILHNTEWKPNQARTRDFASGAFHLKYDKQGNIKWSGLQTGKYKQGTSPAMDKVLQKLFHEYGIADRTSGIITNWYSDGQGYLGSHRHDCWTALFSFGHERILTIDNTPMLMQDGDLVIFGTQRHGVPVMPEIKEGRITFVIFFYPTHMQKKGMWQTITDPETMEASSALKKMLNENNLGSAAEDRAIEVTDEMRALQELGFSRADAEVALKASRFDVDAAAAMLLSAGQVHAESISDIAVGVPSGSSLLDDAATSKIPQPIGRFRKGAKSPPQPIVENVFSSAGASSSSSSSTCPTVAPGTSSASSTDADWQSASCSSPDCSDEALAWKLQLEEDGAAQSSGTAATGFQGLDSEDAALALQLEEEDRQATADPTLLAAQFKMYEDMLTMEDAEKWNGHGDLMHSTFARDTLRLETMDPCTLYSVGCGDMLEKDFWEMLQCNSIRVLYDVRPTDYRGESYSRHQRFSVSALRAQCRTRGIFYKFMPLGREAAYGTLKHIQSDEGKHTLVELAWQGKRKRTAFLGSDEAWRDDHRQVAAEELVKAGHTVEHVRSDGSTERHVSGIQYPDFILRQEERLKLVEKKRQAGEIERVQKSSVDRSSEVVAAKLARPAEVTDAMEEMAGAANQKELVVAQRKLARYQRIAEEKGALASKVLTNVPKWVQDDAQKQAEWVKAKKLEKANAEGATSKAKVDFSSAPSTSSAAPAEADFDEAELARALEESLKDQELVSENVQAESDREACEGSPCPATVAEDTVAAAATEASGATGAASSDGVLHAQPAEVGGSTVRSSWRGRRRAAATATVPGSSAQ
eukprot:TRINITY_DN29523_c0_g6_i1.p1 TRINITY_DN29523_c0_g6~~TRINITY_DN29523_c0_g6_i1.p1  ORF type:complete len:1031 (+),score=188.76 TRINITY_DN29523_c0_g6_i1:74-3094(+)